MQTRLISILIGLSGLALATSLAAHQSGYVGYGSNGVSGSVSISSGVHYGPVFMGTVSFGHPYLRVPAYYPQPVYIQGCGHWHSPGYRHGYGCDYPQGYAHGHSKHHKGSHKRGHGNSRGHGHHR